MVREEKGKYPLPMPTIVTCTCGRRYQAADHLAGQRVPCVCGQFIDVPLLTPLADPNFGPQGFGPSNYGQGYGGQGYGGQGYGYGQPGFGAAPSARPKAPRSISWSTLSAGNRKLVIGLALGGVGLLVVLMVGVGIVRAFMRFAAPTPLQSEDYATARANHRTRLTRRGPSPQPGGALTTPNGAARVTYRSGSLNLTAFVDQLPPNTPPRPAVLFLHGGFAFGDEPGDSDWQMPQPFRDAGFVVMVPVLRGENGQPGTFTLFYDEVEDVVAAGEQLARVPYVDPDRIYVAGYSAGGALAALASLSSKRFRAAAVFSGCMDAKELLDEEAPFNHSDQREVIVRSPIAYAGSFKCPTRLFYGRSEPWMRPGNRQTAQLAQERGLDVKAVEVGGDHGTAVFDALPLGVAFFREQDAKLPRRATPSPRPARPGANSQATAATETAPARPAAAPVPAPPDTMPSIPIPPGVWMVAFEIERFPATPDRRAAAQQALAGTPNLLDGSVTVGGNWVVVLLAGGSVNSGPLKSALESAGFVVSRSHLRRGK